jgi:hypothetical protein
MKKRNERRFNARSKKPTQKNNEDKMRKNLSKMKKDKNLWRN